MIAGKGFLDEVLKVPGTRMSKKATSLGDRLKASQDKGTDFKLRSLDHHDPHKAIMSASGEPIEAGSQLNTAEDYKRMLAMVDVKRGEFCCFMIFASTSTADPRVTSLMTKAPAFRPRVAIEREEALISTSDRKAS